MNKESSIETSQLSQAVSSGGKTITVEIYKLEAEASWALEVVDEYNNSTVWVDTFETETSALNEVKKTILSEGIGSLIGLKSE